MALPANALRAPVRRLSFGAPVASKSQAENLSDTADGPGQVSPALANGNPPAGSGASNQDIYGNLKAAVQPKINPVGVLTRVDPTTGMVRPLNPSKNYYGLSADGTRPIERIGNMTPLDQGAFNIGGLGQLRSSMGNVGNDAASIAINANTSGAGVNAAQSRALALGALTSQGPSAAESQLFAGQEAAARNALAMAKSGRGFGSAGALQQAQFAGQEGMQLANQQAATLRAQEEANRRQQLLALGGLDQQALGQAFGTQLAAGNQRLQSLQQSGQLSFLQQQALADREKVNAAMGLDVNKQNAQFANYAQQAPQDNTLRDWMAALNIGGSVLGTAASLYGGGAFGFGGGGGGSSDPFENFGQGFSTGAK